MTQRSDPLSLTKATFTFRSFLFLMNYIMTKAGSHQTGTTVIQQKFSHQYSLLMIYSLRK